jgi:hypothetical protein
MITNVKICVIFSLILLLECCKGFAEEHYNLQIKNNSSFNICCYFYLVWEGGNNGVVYPDTLLSFNKNELIYVNSEEKFTTSRPARPITEWVSSLPKDTISFYFFRADLLAEYSWEEIQCEYNILQRYDLSVEDIHALENQYGIPIIPYPPTEAMKNMKMYPPYKEEE